MNQWEDYSEDEWLKPPSSKETHSKVNDGSETKNLPTRPRLQDPPWRLGDSVGGFCLLRQLGSGSHGWVFEAREEATGKKYALKMLPSTEERESVRAKTGFRRMSKLRHRGLVQLHRINQGADYLGFSMELIEGENLVEVIRKWRTLPIEQACVRLTEMIRQVSTALAWMHARQLIHRDVKPSNLMMSEDGSRFVIVDYDLAGTYDPEADPSGERTYLIWTPMYVAPEVIFRQSYSPASDIFGLGMAALEALRMFTRSERAREAAAKEATGMSGVSDHQGSTADYADTLDEPRRTGAPTAHGPGSLHPDELNLDDAEFDECIPRDDKNLASDREFIVDALSDLHASIPIELRDAVSEMVAPGIAERPMAMTLSRLGTPAPSIETIKLANSDSTRILRSARKARASELNEIQRWSHLVLGGQVRRLHLEGPSGIGKSTVLELALELLRRQPWAQVYVARCQRREQGPLQAFSQIADEIVMQFRRGHLERLHVDSVSDSILRRAIPGFGEVLEVDWSETPLVTSPTRPGGLEAGMKAVEQLRRFGPVFFVIDDVQWADRDTLNALDHFQSASPGRPGMPVIQGLGLITCSRMGGDRQQTKPDQLIQLQPLTPTVTTEVLETESQRRGVSLTASQLDQLVDQVDGLPYRMEAFLAELKPGGLLTQSLEVSIGQATKTVAPTIEEIWEHRDQQLGSEARNLLRWIVVCGRRVSVSELEGLHSQDGILEGFLDELAENRLIVRDGVDGQLIRVWHDRFSEQILQTIPADRQKELHLQWANYLVEQENVLAAEVADHYNRAGEVDDFVVWARRAAAEAQQLYAHSEAARWHRCVADHSEGELKVESLRLSAEALQRGGRLYDAAQTHGELTDLLDGQARIENELELVQCFIRSGRFAETSSLLRPLLARLDLPQPKSPWRTKLSILACLIAGKVKPSGNLQFQRQGTPARTLKESNQISACKQLVRPLSFIDNWLAAELNVFNSQLVRRVGSDSERLEVAVGEAVFASYNPGKSRQQAAKSLQALLDQLQPSDDPGWHADVYSGLAWSKGMNCQFPEVLEPVRKSREFYNLSEEFKGFEVAHTSYIEAAAYFHVGELQSLVSMVEEMHVEAATTNDQFVLAMGTLGYSCAGFLAQDEGPRLQAMHAEFQHRLDQIGPDAFSMIERYKDLLFGLYQDDPATLIAGLDAVERAKQGSPVYRVQVIRLLITDLECLAYLTLSLRRSDVPEYRRKLERGIKRLRRERLDYACMKADLIEGIAYSRFEKLGTLQPRLRQIYHDRAERLLADAANQAHKLKLTPYELAAWDELDLVQTEKSSAKLNKFLVEQDVVVPEKFARLYRGG